MEPSNKGPALSRSFGRQAFGDDPANYHSARPPYPEAVWRALEQRAGLEPNIDILEIGAGTGLATSRLLTCNPKSVVAIEPDVRLADFMRRKLPAPRLEVLTTSFEEAKLTQSFDLVVSATAFHWLDAVPSLRRIHRLLRPSGSVALWWNVFGDDSRPDPYHDATTHLFVGHPSSPSSGITGRPPHALDTEARIDDFQAAGFLTDHPEVLQWTLTLSPIEVRNLYATYSNVTVLPPDAQAALLKGLADVAEREFAGRVERNMTTVIYTAQKA